MLRWVLSRQREKEQEERETKKKQKGQAEIEAVESLPVVVLRNFTTRGSDREEIYDLLAEWAASLVHSSATSSASSDSDSPCPRLADALQHVSFSPKWPRSPTRRTTPTTFTPKCPHLPYHANLGSSASSDAATQVRATTAGGGVAHAHVAVVLSLPPALLRNAHMGGTGRFGQQVQEQSGMGMGLGTRPPPGP
jgi:hypothetical protein